MKADRQVALDRAIEDEDRVSLGGGAESALLGLPQGRRPIGPARGAGIGSHTIAAPGWVNVRAVAVVFVSEDE